MRPADPAETVSYGGAVLALLSAMTLNQWAALIGIISAIGTFLFNVWHSTNAKKAELELKARELEIERQRHERELELAEAHRREQAEEHRLRVRELEGKCGQCEPGHGE